MYCFLIVAFKRTTISTLMNVPDTMQMIDINGRTISLSSNGVTCVLVIGWLSYLLSLILNIIYYYIHPSRLDFDLRRFKRRIVLYICGKKMFQRGSLYSTILMNYSYISYFLFRYRNCRINNWNEMNLNIPEWRAILFWERKRTKIHVRVQRMVHLLDIGCERNYPFHSYRHRFSY